MLDSDVVISRPDALEKAVERAAATDAAVVGESSWDQWHETDPARVWRDGIEPFADGGDPAFDLLQSAQARGETLSEFPFTKDHYVIHRGRGSLSAVWTSGDTAHPLHDWASDHHEPHFAETEGARARHGELLRAFHDEVGPLGDRKAIERLIGFR